jgi:hypothetical protein
MEAFMAVFVQKFFNESPNIVPEGVGICFSKSGFILFILNAEGDRIASFRAQEIRQHWVG